MTSGVPRGLVLGLALFNISGDSEIEAPPASLLMTLSWVVQLPPCRDGMLSRGTWAG